MILKSIACSKTQTKSPDHKPKEGAKVSGFLSMNSKLHFSVLHTYNAQFGNKHQSQPNGQAEDIVTHQVKDGPDPLFASPPKNAWCHTLHTIKIEHKNCAFVPNGETGFS